MTNEREEKGAGDLQSHDNTSLQIDDCTRRYANTIQPAASCIVNHAISCYLWLYICSISY
jgi:hypothetical protein